MVLYVETARQFGIEPGYVITTSDELLRLLEANALVGIAKCDAELAREEQTISVTADSDQVLGDAIFVPIEQSHHHRMPEALEEFRRRYLCEWKPGAVDGLDWLNIPPGGHTRLLDHADRPRPRVYPVPSDDDADLELLSMANELGKFCLELGGHAVPHLQFAFERGIDREWFTLVDISPIAEYPGRMFRCFRLTVAGRGRLLVLKGKKT